jgi:hypothetical protein
MSVSWRRALVGVASISAAVAAALPAEAKYVEADYSGIVLGFAPGESLPGVNTGDPFSYKLVFNDAALVDHTATVNATIAANGGTVLFSSFQAVDLSSDPRDFLTISIGGLTFSKTDAQGYGTPFEGTQDLGSGNIPGVEYINGQFAGVGGYYTTSSTNGGGYFLIQDPAPYREGFIPYPFLLGSTVTGDIILAGYYPYPTSFSITSVPEPATWAMMLIGFAGLGAAIRSVRRAKPAVA